MIINVTGEKKILAKLKGMPKAVDRAKKNAENTTATEIRKKSLVIVSRVYNIKSSRIKKDSRGRKTTYVQKVKQSGRGARIEYKGGSSTKAGDRPGLHHFRVGASQKNKKAAGSNPKIKIKKSSNTEVIDRGFYGEGKLKGTGIWQREEGGRSIHRRTGPSMKQMITDRAVIGKVSQIASPIFTKNLSLAVDKQLNKLAR